MGSKAEQLKAELIGRAAALASARLPAGRATEVAAFIERFYGNVAADDLLDEPPEDLYASALSLWTFGAQRPPRTAKVRVYNPRLEEQGWRSHHTILEMVNDDMPFLVDSV